jgi:hypothetical protein
VSEEPTWRDLVTRLDDGGDDRHIFDRIFRCDVDGCPKSIKGEGPTKQHVENAHEDLLRPGPRGHPADAETAGEPDSVDDVDEQPTRDGGDPAPGGLERRPSRWQAPDLDLDERPEPRRQPDGVDGDQDDVDEHTDGQPHPDRGDPGARPAADPEEFVPVAQAFRQQLDRGLEARGADPDDLPPEAFRESVDLEAAKVLAKYMPTHGSEINLAFMLLVGYGPVLWQLRQDTTAGLDEDKATEQGMTAEDVQRAQQPEGEISAEAKQDFLEAMA